MNSNIFRHLKPEIASAIPALDEWKIHINILASQMVIVYKLSKIRLKKYPGMPVHKCRRRGGGGVDLKFLHFSFGTGRLISGNRCESVNKKINYLKLPLSQTWSMCEWLFYRK